MLRKKLGQHFLKNNYYIEKILNSFEVSPPANVLEIGPGKGNITFPLIEKGYNVIAIEKDKKFETHLKDKKLKVFFKDALIFPENIEEFLKENKISILFSNLPYSAGTKIFLRYLPFLKFLKQMVLMFQYEVGEKILSEGSLYVVTNLIAKVKIICKVPPEAFSPKPKVESILLSFKNKNGLNFPYDKFLKFLSLCFKHPRKTLYNNLIVSYKNSIINNVFDIMGWKQNIRAHELKPQDFLTIFKKFEGNYK